MLVIFALALLLSAASASKPDLPKPIGLCSTIQIEDLDTPRCANDPDTKFNCTIDLKTERHYCMAPKRLRQVNGDDVEYISCIAKIGTEDCSTCEKTTCDGTPEYCALPDHKCPVESPCRCSVNHYSRVRELQIKGSWRPYKEELVGFAVDPIEFIEGPNNRLPFGYDPGNSKRRSLSQIRQSVTTTSASLDQSNLIVVTPTPGATRIVTTKDGLQNMFGCAEIQCINRLPDTYFMNPGTLAVRVYVNDTLDLETTLTVIPYIKCNVPRCVLCASMYNDFPCFPWQFQMFVVVSIISGILGCLLMIFAMMRGICACSCFRKCGKKSTTVIQDNWSGMKGKMKKWFNKKKRITSEDEESADTELKPIKSRGVEIELIRETPRRVPFMAVILFMGLISSAMGASCASGITVSVANSACFVDGTTEVCTVSFDTLFSIPAPGLAACFTIKKLDDTPIGQIDIVYDRMMQVAPLQSLYYTSSWFGGSYSDKQCPWEHMCGNCANYNPLTDPAVCGGTTNCLITGLPLMYQGLSRCDSQCGCAGCGCFACDASCVYSRAYIAPAGTVCQVLRPISVSLRPQLSVNFTHSGTSDITSVDIISSETQVGLNFTITMLGSLAGSTTNFAGQNIVACDGGATMGSTSSPNSPVANSVGDIQANSPSQLGPFGIYQLAAGLWTPLLTSTATNYIFAPVGFNSRSSHDSLPTVRGSTLWTMAGPNLIGEDAAPGAVLANLQTLTPITLTRTVNVVCPRIIQANLTGCFSCDQGATITIRAKSTCSAGLASVIASGSYTASTLSVNLQTGITEFQIRVTSGTASNTGVIKLKSGQYEDSITVVGTLIAEDLIVNTNQTFTNTTGGIASFADWFGRLTDVFKGLLVTGMVIFAIIAFIVVAVIIFRVMKSWKEARIQSRYDKLQGQEQERALKKMELRNLSPQDFE